MCLFLKGKWDFCSLTKNLHLMLSLFDFALLCLINGVMFGDNTLKVYEGADEREENVSWRL